MKARSFVAFAITASVIGAAKASNHSFYGCDHSDMDPHCTYKTQNEWTYMVLSQTWEGTFCNDGCCLLPSGATGLTSGVTIHGLWPNYEKGYPSCCKCSYTDAEVDNYMTSNAQMYRDLNTYWPSLKKCKFVSYEWRKHGTCAASVYDGERGYADYFNTVITLHKRWNLYKILSDAGIKPSNTTRYPATKITKAIEAAVGKTVALTCSSGKLAEIRICIGRPTSATKLNPSPIDCATSVWNGCSSKDTIILPPPILNLARGSCKI